TCDPGPLVLARRLEAGRESSQLLVELVTLNRDPGHVDRAADEIQVVLRRRAGVSIVEGERAEHARVPAEDRRRPASAEAVAASEVAVLLPERIGLDVRDDDRPAKGGGGPTRALALSDRGAVDRPVVLGGEVRRGAVSDALAVGGDEQDRRDRRRRLL